jgi:K+-sensing histidine kinase KdpD
MTMESKDLYAALMHELKNNLGLLAMNIDGIPTIGQAEHDNAVDDARLLCQRVMDRLHQGLLIYKVSDQPIVPSVDAYSPRDLAKELEDTASSLSRGRLQVTMAVSDTVPEIWFFDRNLVEIALINAIHNSLDYAQGKIHIGMDMMDKCLEVSVWDDSIGFPEHVLESFANRQPYRATGTGLGLQFAQLIAQAHENQGKPGEILLSNRDGALFVLRLP